MDKCDTCCTSSVQKSSKQAPAGNTQRIIENERERHDGIDSLLYSKLYARTFHTSPTNHFETKTGLMMRSETYGKCKICVDYVFIAWHHFFSRLF